MEAPEDAAMVEICTDPVQLKPFELLDDIMNTVRLPGLYDCAILLCSLVTQIMRQLRGKLGMSRYVHGLCPS